MAKKNKFGPANYIKGRTLAYAYAPPTLPPEDDEEPFTKIPGDEEEESDEDEFNRKPVREAPREEDSTLGNGVGKPKAESSVNAIIEMLNEMESTTRDSPYWAESQRKPYNPDDIVMRRMDYSIYDKDMPNDDQISVCLELKKDLVLGSGFEFVCEGDTELGEAAKPALQAPKSGSPEQASLGTEQGGADLAELIKKDLEVAFNEDPDLDIDQSFEEMLVAYEIGFSLTEKVWKKREDGSMTIKSLKTRHPSTWLLHTDKHGNVEKYEQRTSDGPKAIKPTSLIHYINNSRYQNPYGKSDLRAAYDAWFIKREIIKYYAIFLEKAASPMPYAKYPANTPPEQITALFNVVKKFQTKTAMVVPKDVEIQFLESKSNGEAYVKAINIFNMFIGRALFIPDLLGFQGAETSGGSYSLGKDQMAVLFKHIHKRRTRFEKLINIHLVKPFVLYNYGDVDKYPKFRLKEISDERASEYAKLWIEAIKGKFYEPSDEEINHFRKMIKFPVGPVAHPAPVAVSPTLPDGTPNPAYDPELEKAKQEDQKAKLKGEEVPNAKAMDGKPKETVVGDPKPGAKAPPAKGEDDQEPKREYAKAFDGTPGDYSRKTNFKLLKSGLDTSLAKIMDEGKPLIKEIFEDLFTQIRDKKIVQSQDLAKIDKIKVKKLPALKSLLKRRFLDLRNDQFKQARSEIVKGASKYAAPLPNEKFMDFLEEETFQYIGDWEFNVKKKVRLALIDAIKDGKPISDVIGVLDEDGVALATTSLERFARTKLTEVMNRARKEAFEDTGVVAAYQFSAIMDDRVSEICGGLHGSIFEKDDAPTPPLHFNCRSVLIPITKYESYEVTKTAEGMNIDKFIDENIGDGFSRQ